jgi:general secretion pathway protein H
VNKSRGFTMVELLVVFAIIAMGISLVVLALPDGEAAKLEEEGARLSSLLESARAEARVAGVAVRWVPRASPPDEAQAAGDVAQFQFVGLPSKSQMPTRFLDGRTQAQVVGTSHLVLGPEAILPAQRLVLRLGERRLELASDGLGPFAEPAPAGAEGAASGPTS